MKTLNPSDPLLSEIEAALAIGHFIHYNDMTEFIEDLESVSTRIESLIEQAEPARAVCLLEVFIAGCSEKIEEVDDSSGGLGQFVKNLVMNSVKAREAAKEEPKETIAWLLGWVATDDYGFFDGMERKAVTAMGPPTLQTFRFQIEEELLQKGFSLLEIPDKASKVESYEIKKRISLLKAIYSAQRDEGAFVTLVNKMGASSKDCEILAQINVAQANFERALSWVNQGLNIQEKIPRETESSYELPRLKRELLIRLNRTGEAIESAWVEFEKRPSVFGYKEILELIPDDGKKEWYQKSLQTMLEKGDLGDVIEFCTQNNEIETLAERVTRSTDAELKELSYYVSQPAADNLLESYPSAALRLYLKEVHSILDSKKSKLYPIALGHLEKIKLIHEREGLQSQWVELVENLRQDHRRKSSFIGDFERIVSGVGLVRPPSFLERVQARINKNKKPQ